MLSHRKRIRTSSNRRNCHYLLVWLFCFFREVIIKQNSKFSLLSIFLSPKPKIKERLHEKKFCNIKLFTISNFIFCQQNKFFSAESGFDFHPYPRSLHFSRRSRLKLLFKIAVVSRKKKLIATSSKKKKKLADEWVAKKLFSEYKFFCGRIT